jgi:hypothetical protein
MKILSLLFLCALSALAAEGKLLKPFKESKPLETSKRPIFRQGFDKTPTILVNLDRSRAWVTVDGEILELENPDKSSAEGKKFTRVFKKGPMKLSIAYEVLSSGVNLEMGCERTEYRLSIEFVDKNKSEKFSPESYGEGC